MRITNKCLLGSMLLALACESHDQEPVIDHAPFSDTKDTSTPTAEDEFSGAAIRTEGHMKLDEGAAGKPAQLSRQQAIEQARTAGIPGSEARGNFGYGRHGFGTGGIANLTDGSGRDTFRDHGKNPWVSAKQDRISTFAADVDTASYTLGRRFLQQGQFPTPASVRVEEYVNYFRYAFPAPTADTPFAVVMDAAPSPFSADRHIVRVGVTTRVTSATERQPANLVFLVDVSGSMQSPDKLALAQKSLRILTENLRDGDSVALVTYAGDTRVVLPATGMQHRTRILAAIDALSAEGSTAMGSGLDLAYREAMKGLRPGVTSRVVVLSDGDANVGPQGPEEILKIIAGRASEGVTLTTVGFGMGNYQDETMEQLADKGNGNNFYIDTLEAATKVFHKDLVATLEVVAKDVKLQVDFDPAMVSRYRLVGYENREIADKDFRNDKVDAGEIGAGHQVTALYEVELTAVGKQAAAPIGAVRTRHKAPRGTKAIETAFPMIGGPASSLVAASSDFRFAFAVAAFADVLRGNEGSKNWSLKSIRDLASANAGIDVERLGFVKLVDRAIALRAAS